MTRDEAWLVLTALNPLLADGHLSITYPGGAEAELQRHLRGGGVLFPWNVHVDARGDLYIRSKLDGSATPLAGARVEMLDGRPAREVAAKLLAHTNGDTPAFRAALLSNRFPFWYWKFFGERRTYRVRVAGKDSLVAGSTQMPFGYREKTFDELFRLDVRGAAAVIATSPYQNGSTYVLKIIEGRRKEGQKVGDVVRGSQETVYQPQLDNPLRFKGKLYVLISRRTYSSAVLFANVVQDRGFGTLAGVGGAARSTQTGGTQNIELPNTGIGLVAPRLVMKRPSGAEGLLEPDVPVADDPYRPTAAIESLLRR
jgi:hypothetical protein